MTGINERSKRFSPSELHLILNRLGQASMNAEHNDAVGRCLAAKKKKGIPIDDKAIAICINENKPKTKTADVAVSSVKRKTISSSK